MGYFGMIFDDIWRTLVGRELKQGDLASACPEDGTWWKFLDEFGESQCGTWFFRQDFCCYHHCLIFSCDILRYPWISASKMIKHVKVKHFHSQKLVQAESWKTNLSLTSLIHFFKLTSWMVPDFQGNKMLMFREVSLSQNQARKGGELKQFKVGRWRTQS